MAAKNAIDGRRRGRRLGTGAALAALLLAAGCGVKSAPERPGDYNYPADYPSAYDDPIAPAGDVPTLETAPSRAARDRDRRAPARRDNPAPPATETILR